MTITAIVVEMENICLSLSLSSRYNNIIIDLTYIER